MPYSCTRSQLTAILAGPAVSGFITTAKFKKLTTPPAFRVFRTYIRPHCPFRHYLHLRHNPYFDNYLKHHRRKRHPVLTKPLLDLSRLKYWLKNGGGNRRCTLTLKMQNKPKSQTDQVPLSSFNLRTKDDGLKTAPPKNKPKQTQMIDIQSLYHSECKRGIYLIRHPKDSFHSLPDPHPLKSQDSSLKTLFMTNEPNFTIGQSIVTLSPLRTKDDGLRTAPPKNEPNSNPIHISPESLSIIPTGPP